MRFPHSKGHPEQAKCRTPKDPGCTLSDPLSRSRVRWTGRGGPGPVVDVSKAKSPQVGVEKEGDPESQESVVVRHRVPPGVQARGLMCGGCTQAREVWVCGLGRPWGPGVSASARISFQLRGLEGVVACEPSSLREVDGAGVRVCATGQGSNDPMSGAEGSRRLRGRL